MTERHKKLEDAGLREGSHSNGHDNSHDRGSQGGTGSSAAIISELGNGDIAFKSGSSTRGDSKVKVGRIIINNLTLNSELADKDEELSRGGVEATILLSKGVLSALTRIVNVLGNVIRHVESLNGIKITSSTGSDLSLIVSAQVVTEESQKVGETVVWPKLILKSITNLRSSVGIDRSQTARGNRVVVLIH